MIITEQISDFYKLFFPKLCGACNTTLAKNEIFVCVHCRIDLPYTKFESYKNNAVQKTFDGRIPIENAMALLFFAKDESTQHLLHHIKYNNKTELAIFLGKLIGEKLLTTNWINDIDAILPIPLHPKKERKRGYNQCDFIAKGIAETINKKVIKNNLIRITDTSSQTLKSRIQRWENMKDNFDIKNPIILQNKNILLIDDVITTGATLEAAAQSLILKCNCKINIATLAFAN